MAETSKIEWTDSTFNPWIGCTKIAPACDFCYAEAMARRRGWAEWGNHPRHRTSVATWREPLKWQREAAAFFEQHGRRRRVFCASLADVFDNQVPDEWRHDLWSLIEKCWELDWLLLTKRPQNIAKMLPDTPIWENVRQHVWLGTTVEDQEHADCNLPHLLKHDSAVRFVSVEPMLGPIDLTAVRPKIFAATVNALNGLWHWDGGPSRHEDFSLDWVIAGGESGQQARPSHPAWFRSLRDQCERANVPFLFKQWGNWAVAPDGLSFDERMAWARRHEHSLSPPSDAWGGMGGAPTRWHNFGDGLTAFYTTKQKAGRRLDGVDHTAFPASSVR